MVKEDIIPKRLQRFLLTTSRRKGIFRYNVAAVAIKGRQVVLDPDNRLPTKKVQGERIGEALRSLAQELSEDYSVKRYLGFADYSKENLRQFYFHIEIGRPRKEICLVPLGDAPSEPGIAAVFDDSYLCVKR